MIKRLSVGAGAEGQALADALYDEAVRLFKLRAGALPHVHLKLWEERPWVQSVAPVRDSGRHL